MVEVRKAIQVHMECHKWKPSKELLMERKKATIELNDNL